MGGVAVLHPQDCLKDRHDNLFSTPVKSRRTPKPSPSFSSSSPNFSNSSPNSTRSEGRKRSPPTGVRRNNKTTSVAKNLVMGQVKILKRGEALNEATTSSKEVSDRKVPNGVETTPFKDVKVSKDSKKKVEKEKKRGLNSSPKVEVLKVEDFSLSSTDRLGPDPEMVPIQKKNIAEFFFAGSAFVDSPPPSSLPLPGFFTKNFVDPSTDLRRILGLSLS